MCLVDARARVSCVGLARDGTNTEKRGEEGYATESFNCTHLDEHIDAFVLGSEVCVPRKVRCITAIICVGGRTSMVRVSPSHARQLIRGGLKTSDTYVRRPLVHLIGLNPQLWPDYPDWTDDDKETCKEMLAKVDDIGKGVLSEYKYLSYWSRHPIQPYPADDVRYCGLWIGDKNMSDREFTKLERVYTWPTRVQYTQRHCLYQLAKRFGGVFIDWAYPTGNKALRAREKIDAVDAFRIALAMMSPEQISAVMYYSLGLGGQTLCRMLLFATLTPDGPRILNRLYHLGCFTGEVVSTVKRLKAVHVACRQCDSTIPLGRQLCDVNVDHVLYCNLLVGRVPDIESDLDDIRIRSVARAPRPLDNEVEAEGLGLLRELLSAAVPYGSVSALGPCQAVWQAFLSELTSGSSSQEIPRELKEAGIYSWSKAKASILSSYRSLLLRAASPGLRGTAIVKYEPGGRNRPLLPSDDSDWLRWTLLLMWVENKLWRIVSASPMKWDAADWVGFGISTRLATAAGAWLTASDFDDYNQLHTNEIMAGIAMEIGHHLAYASCDPQYELLAQRIADGILYNKLNMPDGVMHTAYGLWSGWRSTSFINTLLNPIYNRLHSAKNGKWPLCSLFQGDDSVDVWDNGDAAIECLNQLDQDGFYAQHAKQMVSRRRLEFLRVMWRDGMCGQGSLIRAISNSVSADLQSSEMCETLTMSWLDDFQRRLKRRGAVISRQLKGIMRSVVARKISKFTNYRERHMRLSHKQSHVMFSLLERTRRNPITMAIGDRPYYIPERHWDAIKKEVDMRYVGPQPRVDSYNVSKPSARVAELPEKITGDEKLRAIYAAPEAAYASEVFSRILGPLNASILARELLVKNVPTVDLLRLAKIGAGEYPILCSNLRISKAM